MRLLRSPSAEGVSCFPLGIALLLGAILCSTAHAGNVTAAAAAADDRAAQIGSPTAAPEAKLVAARVVSALIATGATSSEPAIADDKPKQARKDQAVRLYALISAQVGGARRWYSDAPQVRLDGKLLPTLPLADLPQAALRWYRVEPTVATMSNTESGSFRFEPVPYQRTLIEGSAGRASLLADVRPTLTPDHGGGVGTMRYAIELSRGGARLTSPGAEARRGRGSGGLLDTVHRVSIRRDDTYLGYLTEMFGQPYIWASAGTTPRAHQSERLEGSDCADFIIYGARRMGKALEYTWSGGLPSVTRLLARGERGDDGLYRDASGKPLPFPAVGDIILFPRHVGALSVDRGRIGLLDDQDLMLHTLFDSPKEQAIADSGYAQTTVELRRWKK